jgi:hypothetical protein
MGIRTKLAIATLLAGLITTSATACPNGWSGNPCKPGMNNPPIKPLKYKKQESTLRVKAPVKKGPGVCAQTGKDKYGKPICIKKPANSDK